MKTSKLKKGDGFIKEYKVQKQHTTSHIGVSVLSTPSMIGLIEKSSNEFIQDYLEDDYTTVGTLVNFTHENPVLFNDRIAIKGNVMNIEKNKIELKIKVSRKKDSNIVSKGKHVRFIVNKDRFSKKLEENC